MAKLTLAVFAIGAQALAHPGHDHTAPTGAWPTHAPDQHALRDTVFFNAEPGEIVAHPVQTMVWKLADGTTGSSPNGTIQGNIGQHHSPILGFTFDGFPIYGPYAYANGDDNSTGYQQMTSSYQLITERPTNGPSQIDYELGSFAEDFEYVAGSGSLNKYNMAFVITPEYPGGTWAYFTTFDVGGSGTSLDGDVAFPFTVGPHYFGEVDQTIVGRNPMITVPNDVTFTFQYVVPEPSTISLTTCSLALTLPRRRRC